ncbi:YciI family protein [uncultured Microbacterium sp.]|uniref:YciI family protein n=1 Tax=uncultured Microbacterium sp. TaxID=191216 RepID=UPI0025FD65F4|nr:YciI family protein [uncultured Microbacterium sp.]
MKVMLVMWSDGSYEGGDAEEDFAAWMRYEDSLRADGVMLDSGRFAEVDGARAVVTAISRAPDAEPQPSRALSGYYVLEVDDADAATAYARRAPLYGTVEVRPLVEY